MNFISHAWAYRPCILLFLLLTSASAVAQKTQLQLLDKITHSPIVGVSYYYEGQSGSSDENGWITINITKEGQLKLQHLSYGRYNFSFDDLQKSKLYLEPKEVRLQPVSVIGVEHGIENRSDLSLTTAEQVQHDAGELLNSLPEIAGVRKSGAYGFDPVFRGFSGDQLNIVLDGNTKAIAACPNRMDPPTSQISPNMIDEIELLKGPYGLRYGNSFGATIQYKTAESTFSDKQEWNGRLTSNFNENGNISHNEMNIGLSTKKVNVNLFGSYADGSDFSAGDDLVVLSAFERGSIGLKTGLQFNSQNQMNVSLTRNFARDTDFPSLAMDLRSDHTWLVNASFHHTGKEDAKNKEWITQAYYTNVDHTMDNLGKVMPMRMVNAVTDAVTSTLGLRSETTLFLNNSLLIAGVDYNYQTADGKRRREFLMGPMAGNILTDNAWQGGQIHNMGMFGEYHFAQPKTDYVIAARIDVNDANLSDADEAFQSLYTGATDVSQLNPSISIGAVKHLPNEFDASLWLGRAQRSASLTERYINFFPIGLDPYEMVGNPNLNTEVNYQVDAKLNKEYDKAKWQISGFVSYLNNYIQGEKREDLTPVIPNSPGVRQFQNIGNAMKYGFEGSARHQINSSLNQQVLFAYTWGQDEERNQPLAQIAPFDLRYHLNGNFFNKKVKPQLSFRYVAEQNRVSEEYSELPSEDFAIIDFNTHYQFNQYLNLSIGVENLLDNQYFEFLNRPVRMIQSPLFSPGRSAHVALSLDF